MRTGPLPLACSMFAAWVLASTTAAAEVVTCPAPSGETLSKDYEVQADGKKVDVYTARTLDPPFAGKEWDHGGPYSFANFDTSGPVTVRITAKRSLARRGGPATDRRQRSSRSSTSTRSRSRWTARAS